ncbi:MAG: protein kinase domain-containing protein [Candidatus Flexifilum sp.]
MSVTDPFIGHRLGDYKIVDILGRGGMARVYRGYDERLNRYAAVKVIDAALLSGGEEEYRLRFLREARAIAALDHPAIVSVYQFGEFEGLYYMAMKFIEGRDLGQILKEDGGVSLTSGAILRIVRDVAAALDYAHAAGVIHRDVKPSNIMITRDGHAILTDFGLALSVPEGSIGNTFGSAHYIAPEQALSSAQAVPQSDLYSLGVVIYQMFTGRVPFDDPSAMTVALKHLSDPPPPPRTFNPNIPVEVERVILRTLEKEIDKRYESGAQLVYALELALGLGAPTFSEPLPFSASEFAGGSSMSTRAMPSAPPEISSSALTPIKRRSEEFPAVTPPQDSQPSRSTASLSRHLHADPTPSEARISTTASLPRASIAAEPEPPRRARRQPLLLGGLLLAAIAAIGGLLLLNPGRGGPTSDAVEISAVTGTAVALAGAALTEEATAAIPTATAQPATPGSPAETPESSPPTNTPSPSSTLTATRTSTPRLTATLTSSRTPTNARTAAVTVSPVVTAPATSPTAAGIVMPNEADAEIELVYDALSFILHNIAAHPVDVSGWRFVQTLPGGETRAFDTSLWDGGSRPVYALPPNDCFQAWDILTVGQLPLPEICGIRHAWRAIAPQRQFWISPTGDPAAVFEVRASDGRMLARCPIRAGRCLLDLDRLAEP